MMSTPQQLGEMLEVLDDDALTRRVRPPRRLLRPGDQGDPRHRAVSVAVRAHPCRRNRAGAGRGSGRSPASTRRPRCWRPTTSTSAGSGSTSTTRCSGAVLLPGRARTAHAEGGWRLHHPRRAPPTPRSTRGAAAQRRGPTSRQRQPRRATAARHPRPRLHHGVVGSVPHPAARRPRRRGDPGREPVGVPAHHEGLPAAADPPRCCSAACCRCTRPRSTASTTGRTTATR